MSAATFARHRQTPPVALASPRRVPVAQHFLHSSATPLDSKTRAFFERRFGHDFSGVRVHSNAEAAASARAMHANAYTIGRHIAFDTGKYQPGSSEGQKLIAHELAHTVQQKQATSETDRLFLGKPQDQSEAEADRASEAVDHGPISVEQRRPLSVQRQVNPAPRSLDLDLAESATPFMAAAIGSVTVDHFETGKTDLSEANLSSLSKTAEVILKLMRQYPGSTVGVIGHTDAVGQENDNQALGQRRADAVQNALAGMGVPAKAMHTESHGASELLVKTKTAEPRNRRVDVRFAPSRRFSSVMAQGLSPGLTGGPASKAPQAAPTVDLYKLGPRALDGHAEKPGVPPAALQPLPSDIPYELMDVPSLNEPFIAHGHKPEDGDLRATWGRLYLMYKYQYHLSKELAAKAANQALGAAAGSSESRDSPNALDRSNSDFKNAYPNATGVGPFNLPWKLKF